MEGLLELIFEGVPERSICPFLLKLIHNEDNVVEIIQDGDEYLFAKSEFALRILGLLKSNDDDMVIFINLKQLLVGVKSIKTATVQLIRHSCINDVVVLFSTTDCKSGGIIYSEEIYGWAEELARFFDASDFLGGLEPAADEETQIFSAKGVGPIAEL